MTPAERFKAGLHTRLHVAIVAKAHDVAGFGMVVMVTGLPLIAFDPAHLLDGPGNERPLFTAHGVATWNALHDFARWCVAQHGAPGDLAGVVLAAEATDTARLQLQMQRAA